VRKKESIVPPMLSPEITSEESKTPSHYIEQAEELLAHNQKERALQILKEGIFALGGSQAPESAALMALWWNTMLWNAEGEEQELTAEDMASINEMVGLISHTDCYLLKDELSVKEMFSLFKLYAYHWWAEFDKNDNEYLVLYPDSEWHELIVLPPDTVREMIGDVFGVWRDDLAEEYYANNAEELQEVMEDYPEYVAYADMKGAYFYEPGDPDYLSTLVQGYEYLGDDIFYVVFYYDCTSKVDMFGEQIEEGDWIENFVHVIVKRANNRFGFTVLAKPQDRRLDGISTLIQSGWKQIEVPSPPTNRS
jgi:hypothetical protein